MEDTLENTATETLDSLEARLRRLEYLLVGNPPTSDNLQQAKQTLQSLSTTQETALLTRLATLDKHLNTLYNKLPLVKHMLDLQSTLPELFPPPSSNTTTTPIQPPPLPPHILLSTILPLSPTYHSVSSQLLSIADSPIPNPHSSASLIALLPTIQKIQLLQEAQSREITELRARSIALLERWYLVGIEGVNEVFAECDERTTECDRVIRRKLRLKELEGTD